MALKKPTFTRNQRRRSILHPFLGAYMIRTGFVEAQILNDLPELEASRRAKTDQSGAGPWQILDSDSTTVLLAYTRKSGHADYTGNTGVAIAELHQNRFELRHYEEYGYATALGLLNAETGDALMVRWDEHDDTVSHRHGRDELYIVRYRVGDARSVYAYNFGIGAYSPGHDVRVALNRKRNWLAVARHECDGWQPESYRVTAAIYDLADFRAVASGVLEQVASLNSVDLPGVGDFLIVTDQRRRDHAYVVNSRNVFRRVQTALPERRWQVAISFAGSDRGVAEQIAVRLKERGISVFYDIFEKSNLLGKDLYQYLFDVYSAQAEYCVLLISQAYRDRDWTRHELKAMQAAALKLSREYILPVRLDDADIPGLPPQIGYVDLRADGIEVIVQNIAEKIQQN